ncbi:TIGR01777 family oxidoreductase [Neptuniibacter sp. QD37_11]|uniref:TIGR01777 family oxidoreductase n=1 Tax=Neptuniibacter sp. QD37_11 TaxID=3398209 RepID=UPI0039F62983
MKILVTGGTGFIGKHLIEARLEEGDEVVCWSRNPSKVAELFQGRVEALRDLPPQDELAVDAVINLAGEPIADQKWTEDRKQLLRASRIDLTHELVGWIEAQTVKPKVLISGSAIGYYGCHDDDKKLGEESLPNRGFTHTLCADWEAEALKAEAFGVRVCLIRTGVVLGDGGALSKMLLPFKLGLGGPIASGKQWMSWIHIDDEIEIISMLLTHDELSGPFNLTSPNAATNAEFSKTLGKTLGRPAFMPMPGIVINLMLGEGAELLVEGQRVYPEKLEEIGYKFHYPELSGAMYSAVNF